MTSAKVIAPIVLGILMLALWEGAVRIAGIEPYILPGPILVAKTLVTDWGTLAPSLLVTVRITLEALAAAVAVGGLLAILFSLSRWLELSLFPYAIILQVTPIVAIAPLIIVWADNVELSLLICPGWWPSSPSCRTPSSACAPSIPTCSTCSSSTAPVAGAPWSISAFPRRCRTSWVGCASRAAWR
jgi:hypothetical protein